MKNPYLRKIDCSLDWDMSRDDNFVYSSKKNYRTKILAGMTAHQLTSKGIGKDWVSPSL